MFINKTKKVIVFEEINGNFIPKKKNKRVYNKPSIHSVMALVPPLVMLPTYAFANTNATDEASRRVFDAAMSIVDHAVVYVILAGSCAWMLGHRNKAIHILISVCAGYLLAQNAVNIRDFLKDI